MDLLDTSWSLNNVFTLPTKVSPLTNFINFVEAVFILYLDLTSMFWGSWFLIEEHLEI